MTTEIRKRAGRGKRLDLLREERRKQRRRQKLATIFTVGGAAVIVVGLIVVLSMVSTNSKNKKITTAPLNVRPMADGNAMGDPNAPVKIVEFSDFQCPGCLWFYENIEPSLVAEYIATGKVYFTYRSMGRWIGSESVEAAEAAYCAGDQGKFWEYHDILYANWTGENVGDFTNDRLLAFAETIGLDRDTFRSCFSANKYSDRVKQDNNDGLQLGVEYTPTIVIDGQIYTGSMDYTDIKQAIDNALAGK